MQPVASVDDNNCDILYLRGKVSLTKGFLQEGPASRWLANSMNKCLACLRNPERPEKNSRILRGDTLSKLRPDRFNPISVLPPDHCKVQSHVPSYSRGRFHTHYEPDSTPHGLRDPFKSHRNRLGQDCCRSELEVECADLAKRGARQLPPPATPPTATPAPTLRTPRPIRAATSPETDPTCVTAHAAASRQPCHKI